MARYVKVSLHVHFLNSSQSAALLKNTLHSRKPVLLKRLCLCVTAGAGAVAAEGLLDRRFLRRRSGLFPLHWICSTERGRGEPPPPNPHTDQAGARGLNSYQLQREQLHYSMKEYQCMFDSQHINARHQCCHQSINPWTQEQAFC